MIPPSLSAFTTPVLTLSWRASWLIVALVLLRLVAHRRVPAQVWSAAWIVVALRLFVPFSFPAGWSPWNLLAQPATESRVSVSATAGQPAALEAAATKTAALPDDAAATIAAAATEGSADISPVASSAQPAANLASASWSRESVLAAVWLAGIALLIAVRLVASWSFRRRLRSAVPVADERFWRVLRGEWQRSGLPRARALPCLETPAVAAPALYGLLRPRLLLPPGLIARLTDDELRHVVLHELGHWRRRDLLAQELMHAAAVLHWFNPLAWIASRLARIDCELACDEFVLRREPADHASAYGETLLKVLGLVRRHRRPPMAVAMLEDGRELSRRIHTIAHYRAASRVTAVAGGALIMVLAAVSLTRETRAQPAANPAATSAPAPAVAEKNAPAPTPKPSSVPAPAPASASSPALAAAGAASTPASDASEPPAASPLKNAIDEQRNKVEALARQMQAYKEAHKMVSFDDSKDTLNATLKARNQDYQDATAAWSVAELRIEQIGDYKTRKADLTDLPFIAAQPLVQGLIQQRASSRIALASAEKDSPAAASATRVLTAIDAELQQAIDSACRQAKAQADEAGRRLDVARQALDETKNRSLELDREGLRFNELARELQESEQTLRSLISRLRDNDNPPKPSNAASEQRRLDAVAAEVARRRTAQEQAAEASAGQLAPVVVHVFGAVNRPGAVAILQDNLPLAASAVDRAGGFLSVANPAAVHIISANSDGTMSDRIVDLATPATRTGATTLLHTGDIVMVPDKDGAQGPRGMEASISGQVKNSGKFTVTSGTSLADLILNAGGFTEAANDKAVRVARRDQKSGDYKVQLVNVRPMLRGEAGPDGKLPVFAVEPGDIVFVPGMDRNVSISGMVKGGGKYPLPADADMTLKDLILKAGGFTDTANGRAVRVSRVQSDGLFKIFTKDVESVLNARNSKTPDDAAFVLEPGDVIFVPERVL